MTFLDLTADNDALWRRCSIHDEPRDDGVCPGCAADALPMCTWCMGTGLLMHMANGLIWPGRCHHCQGTPYRPNPEEAP